MRGRRGVRDTDGGVDERVDRHSKLLLELQIKSTKVKTKGVRGLPHTHTQTRSKDMSVWCYINECDCASVSVYPSVRLSACLCVCLLSGGSGC